MKQAVIYARVSTKEQEKEGYSIPAQLALLQDYAQRNNITVMQTYTEAETAKKAGRVAFTQMKDYLRSCLHSLDSLLDLLHDSIH